MLTFIFGRSGSGKTTHVINEIKKSVASDKRTYLLVPEQQVYVSECMLADLPPSSALYFEVVSFSRLCEIVFGKYGGLTDAHAGSGERNLVMWQSLRTLGSSDALKEYGKTKCDASFASMMLSVVDELRANSFTTKDCEILSEKCEDEILSRKLSDIAASYALFEANIETLLGEGAFASENKLSRLAELLDSNRFFEGSEVFVDSFTSFTGEEHKILNAIITQADRTVISLCHDGSEPHTESVEETVRRLRRFASLAEIETEVKKLTENRRAKSPSLAAIEEHLWDFSITEETRPQITVGNELEEYKCRNEFEEINLAALKILKAHKDGIKFSEMAVIMRDCESRKGIIDAVFEKAGIPYFYSEKTDLSSTSLARLTLSALRCVTYNFQSEDVMTLLKTGLCGISSRDADLFEDYCFTWSINGAKFTEGLWSMNPDGYTAKLPSARGQFILSAANRVRSKLIDPLVTLRNKISEACGNTESSCRALYEYLSDIKINSSLTHLAERELSRGRVREAGEVLRVYDFLVSALTRISEILKDFPTTSDELAEAIEIMLRNTDIGSVPAVGDCVTVGSAATLRVEGVKVAILLGLCEGEFPAAYSDKGLLTETDKGIMDSLGISLTSREGTIISDELFHVYKAMTTPSEKLILTTISSHVSGGACAPSSAWNRVRFLFPDVREKEFDFKRVRLIANEADNTDSTDTAAPTCDTADEVGQTEQADEQVTEEDEEDFILTDPDGELIEEIDPMFVRMLFGDKLKLTKSRIATFAECPYKYWGEYVLSLREQKPTAISYANSGTIIHYVLENLIKDLKNDDGSLKEIKENDLINKVDCLIKDYIADINCPLPPAMMYSFSRLRDLSLVMARSVIDEFKESKFRVLAFEKDISDDDGDLHPMEIKVGDEADAPTVSLGGTIDRIDFYDDGDKKYVRVVDYKTGTHKFDVTKIATGEDLQLPAYLFTASLKENQSVFGTENDLVPSAALFLSAEEKSGEITPERSGFMLKDKDYLAAASSTMDKKILAGIYLTKKNEISGKAALSENEILGINNTMQSSIAEIASNMYSGKIPRTPKENSCQFCSLKGSCPVAYKKK